MAVTITITPAVFEEKPILRRLMELYLYDFSEFTQDDLNQHGTYEYAYLDQYWIEPERYPFVVRVEGRLAGFVLVRNIGELHGKPSHSIAEFFILRKYRRQQIGRQAARWIFDRFPWHWRVTQIPENLPAQQFWRRVIGEYTGGAYQDGYSAEHDEVVQEFWTPGS